MRGRRVVPVPLAQAELWWALQDLNLQPTDYESAALTIELRAQTEEDEIRFLSVYRGANEYRICRAAWFGDTIETAWKVKRRQLRHRILHSMPHERSLHE